MKKQSNGKIGKTLLSVTKIRQREVELGDQISRDYAGKNPIIVGALKGAFVFMAELMLVISEPVEIDFLAVSSYGPSTKSSGKIRLLKDIDINIAGRHVLIIEDIIDSGLTLDYLKKHLMAQHPASLEVCTLVMRKKVKNKMLAKYVGFYIGDEFIVGHGLDYDQAYRNLPSIHEYMSSESKP